MELPLGMRGAIDGKSKQGEEKGRMEEKMTEQDRGDVSTLWLGDSSKTTDRG